MHNFIVSTEFFFSHLTHWLNTLHSKVPSFICYDLRVSPGDNQAWVIQVISPILLKLDRFKVSILKLKILKWFTFWNFPGGDRPTPILFLVWRTNILLLQAPKGESCSAKGCISLCCYWIHKDIHTLAFYLRSFSSFKCTDVNQALPKFTHVTQSVTNWQNTSYFDKKISNEQHLSCKRSSPQLRPILGLAITIKFLASVNASARPSAKDLH